MYCCPVVKSVFRSLVKLEITLQTLVPEDKHSELQVLMKQFYVEILLGSTATALSSLIRPCKSRLQCSRGNKGSRMDRRTDTYQVVLDDISRH
jgi:hypothetical protein